MNGLYKGKFIIAIYDKDDRFVDVACLPKELMSYTNKATAKQLISKICNGWRTSDKIYLIDATERHNDIFAEEDELFLNFVKDNKKKSVREIAVDIGISERNCYRKNDVFEP